MIVVLVVIVVVVVVVVVVDEEGFLEIDELLVLLELHEWRIYVKIEK